MALGLSGWMRRRAKHERPRALLSMVSSRAASDAVGRTMTLDVISSAWVRNLPWMKPGDCTLATYRFGFTPRHRANSGSEVFVLGCGSGARPRFLNRGKSAARRLTARANTTVCALVTFVLALPDPAIAIVTPPAMRITKTTEMAAIRCLTSSSYLWAFCCTSRALSICVCAGPGEDFRTVRLALRYP